MKIEVVATKNGPYLLTGDLSQLELRDGDGNLYDVADKHQELMRAAVAGLRRLSVVLP